MRPHLSIALLGLLSACTAAPGAPPTAQGGSSGSTSTVVQRGAISGQKQQIAYFIQVTPSCDSLGYAVVRVVTPPAHGRLSTEQGQDYPAYNKDNIRFACDAKKVPATLLFYTSDPGYAGVDSATVEAVFADGGLMRRDYTISVK